MSEFELLELLERRALLERELTDINSTLARFAREKLQERRARKFNTTVGGKSIQLKMAVADPKFTVQILN